MVFIIETIITIILFSLFCIISVKKNPLAWIDDYPPAIIKRCKELKIIEEDDKKRKGNFFISKLIKTILIVVLVTWVVIRFNHAKSFFDGFIITYSLWFIVAWYDALIIDCLWFCHDKSIRIPGTEDMDQEYHNYLFHIKMSGIGTLIGLPVAILVGILTTIINLFI